MIDTHEIKTINLEKSKMSETQLQQLFDWMDNKNFHHLIVEFTEEGIEWHNPARA